MQKLQRPTWFRIYLHQKTLLESIPDQDLGAAMKAVMTYFDSGEITPLTELGQVLFSCLKPNVETAYADYAATVESGKRGGRPKKHRDTQQRPAR